MSILRKPLLLSVLLPLISCSGQGPELILRSDNDSAANGVASSLESAPESGDAFTQSSDNANSSATNTESNQQQQSAQNTNVFDPTIQQTEETDAEESGVLIIPRIDPANAPQIDASTMDYIDGTTRLSGEWRNAVQSDSAGKLLGINNFMFGDAEQLLDTSNHHWVATHDGVYFYLLVISDDTGRHQQDNNETRKPWKDDAVELYFDGNHSRLTNYDGVDDFQFLINLQSNAGENNNTWLSNRRFFNTDVSAPTPADFLFSTGLRKGPQSMELERGRTDIYEFRIKISELNIELGKPFGFEIQLNDDDDGGSRDAKWAWAHPVGLDSSNDFTWQNPSYMGSVVLQP